MKKRVLFALCCIMLSSFLFITAFAVEVPDLDRIGSISISMTSQGEAVPGGSLTIYRVAEVHVENGVDYSFRYTLDYWGCQVSLDDIDSADTAMALAKFTAENNISGTELQIDNNGNVVFEDLDLGLYLLIQQEAADGFEPVNSFLVSVPGSNDGRYIYDVDATPKLELERTPTKPTEPSESTEPTTSSKLPQTGLNQWPVPVLAIAGLLLVGFGLLFYNSENKRSHES